MFLKSLFGEMKFGAWKSRKAILWVVFICGFVFMIYNHMMFSQPISVEQEEVKHQRFLNSLDQEDMKHEQLSLNDAKEKVSFVNYLKVKDVQMNRNSNVVPLQVQNIQDSLGNQKQEKRVDFKTPKAETINKSQNIIQPQGVQDRSKNVYAGNAAAQWNGGSFRYNTYGEPVYNHGNRANYIPMERVIHLDLKGAPPLPSTYKVLIPWLAKYGATSILMEYEDMFPWEESLAPIAAKNHYTRKDIQEILALCKENKIDVIPLVQTFGHLEFALKLQKYSYLREVPELPQALCPSLSDSQVLVTTMIDQIMKLHPEAKYIHIGCDEVFQMGECNKCRLKSRESLFLDHVSKTAKYVRSTYKVTPIIWHDMLTHVSESAMKEYNFGELVEPMVWVYAEDVYRFVQPSMWSRFSQVFPNVWGASAFKGAFGEQSTVPNVRRHLDNNLNWLDVMSSEGPKFAGGFRGLVLTGWQRHDHFAVLCELIPAALPSLAINLLAASHGYFNDSIYPKLYEALKCMQTPKYQTGLNLDADPYLWDKFSWCFFSGALVFKSTARLDAAKRDVRSYIDRVTLKRAWVTDYNRRHNFSSPMRIDEDLEELPLRIHTLTLLIKTVKEALAEWFDEWTVGEWIEQHIWPLLNKLETLKSEAESMKKVKIWPVRPLPITPELEVFGIREPKTENDYNTAELPKINDSKQESSKALLAI